MLHQDCVLNLPQNSLPPKQPGFQQGFQPTNHRTSCQSVFATLIIRVGSRKRHSAGSPHFAVCQGEPNSGSPSSTKNMAGAKISEVTFVAVVPCGLWSLGLNGPRDPCTFSIPRDPCLARWQCAQIRRGHGPGKGRATLNMWNSFEYTNNETYRLI